MKKIRFFFKGSIAEKEWLNQLKANQYQLKKIQFFVYTFEVNPTIDTSQLAIELVAVPLKSDFETDENVIDYFEKNLLLSNYALIYTYCTTSRPHSVANLTAELHYLSTVKKRMLQLTILLSIMASIIWIIGLFPEYANGISASILYLLALVWGVVLHWLKKINQRIQNNPLTHHEQLSAERTVVIKNSPGQPAISHLTDLGDWRFITEKKQVYYYKIRSDYTEADLQAKISASLQLDLKDVQVISNLGMFPAHW